MERGAKVGVVTELLVEDGLSGVLSQVSEGKRTKQRETPRSNQQIQIPPTPPEPGLARIASITLRRI